jgi:hypothetical protein
MTNNTFDPHQRKQVGSCDLARRTDFASVAHGNVRAELAKHGAADLHELAFLAERGCLVKDATKRTALREVA